MNICIYNYKLANLLMQNGYKMVSMRPNKREVGLLVFYFKEDNGIRSFMQNYSNKTNNSEGETNGGEKGCNIHTNNQ